jgi:hypothetical protein
VPLRPLPPPSNRTRAFRAAMPLARGQGCPRRHEPSISRAAIPPSRIRGPSRHQTGPSPSHTLMGVQANICPAGTVATARSKAISISDGTETRCSSCVGEERQCPRYRGGLVSENIIAAQTDRQMPGQLRHRTPPCGRVTAANIRYQCRLGGCERHLEMEGQAIFIDSEHERNIEQKKNIRQEATLYPGLPIILASGYSHVLADEGASGFALLNKPYSMDELSSILRKTARSAQGPTQEAF